jgi:glycosyltransferase involved in cell wall biosynthesis
VPDQSGGRRFRLGALVSHPIPYQVPLFQKLALHPAIDLSVYYCFGREAQPFWDTGFGRELAWDLPLLEGYRYKLLWNASPWEACDAAGGFWSLINPGIVPAILNDGLDALWVHSYARVTNWLAIAVAGAVGLPVLLRTESSLTYDARVRRPFAMRVAKTLYLRSLFRFVQGYLAIGSRNAEFFRHYGARPEQIFHVPYAVDNHRFAAAAKSGRRAALREQLGIPLDALVYLFAARLVPEKAPGDLLEAWGRLGSMPGTELVFVGDGELSERLARQVSENGIQNVHMLGFKNQLELPDYYALADVFVRTDGVNKGDWGLTVNEAMAAGLAVLSSREIGATADLVIHEDNGLLFDAGDVATLASHIRRLSLDRQLVRNMKERSSIRIADWSYDQCVVGILTALEATVGRRGRERLSGSNLDGRFGHVS